MKKVIMVLANIFMASSLAYAAKDISFKQNWNRFLIDNLESFKLIFLFLFGALILLLLWEAVSLKMKTVTGSEPGNQGKIKTAKAKAGSKTPEVTEPVKEEDPFRNLLKSTREAEPKVLRFGAQAQPEVYVPQQGFASPAMEREAKLPEARNPALSDDSMPGTPSAARMADLPELDTSYPPERPKTSVPPPEASMPFKPSPGLAKVKLREKVKLEKTPAAAESKLSDEEQALRDLATLEQEPAEPGASEAAAPEAEIPPAPVASEPPTSPETVISQDVAVQENMPPEEKSATVVKIEPPEFVKSASKIIYIQTKNDEPPKLQGKPSDLVLTSKADDRFAELEDTLKKTKNKDGSETA